VELGNGDDETGHRHRAPASGGLRWQHGAALAGQRLHRLLDVDHSVADVHVTALEREQLADTKAAPAGQQDERLGARFDHLDESLQVVGRDQGAFGAVLAPGALDATWLAPENPVVQGG
jgi:hypothetical protein